MYMYVEIAATEKLVINFRFWNPLHHINDKKSKVRPKVIIPDFKKRQSPP